MLERRATVDIFSCHSPTSCYGPQITPRHSHIVTWANRQPPSSLPTSRAAQPGLSLISTFRTHRYCNTHSFSHTLYFLLKYVCKVWFNTFNCLNCVRGVKLCIWSIFPVLWVFTYRRWLWIGMHPLRWRDIHCSLWRCTRFCFVFILLSYRTAKIL